MSGMVISGSQTLIRSGLEASREGLRRSNEMVNRGGRAMAAGEVTSSRMVEAMVGERMYAANARVFRTQAAMVGALLRVSR